VNSLFPFGLPFPTAFYLVLYVLTFALHQAFMHYVLGGSVYLAWCNLFPGDSDSPRTEQPLARVLRDWMPFMLSAAITAGVAPLLFVQIVYPKEFYTANLLLSWRWMVVIPVLIVNFYLLYVVKSRKCANWPSALRTLLNVVIAAGFVFVGFCWTANHLISMNETGWPAIYETGSVALSPAEVTLRILIWSSGAVLTMAVFAGWQLSFQRTLDNVELIDPELRRLGRWSLGAMFLGAIVSGTYLEQLNGGARDLVLGAFAFHYLAVAIFGVILQAVAWLRNLRSGFERIWLIAATLGWLLTLISVSIVREAIRLSHIELPTLFDSHAAAREIGGFEIFLLFAAINFGVIGYCVLLVRQGLHHSGDAESVS